jgi:disulfide bond formation protein DsbB
MRFGDLLALIIVAAVGALVTAKIAEIYFHLPPCKLCTYQRMLYAALIIVSSVFFINRYYLFKIGVIILILVASVSIAFYHVGVEKKWFHYESSCTASFSKAKSFEEYKNMLEGKDVVSCDQSFFHFLGISIAGWNMIYSSLLLLITLVISIKHNWFKDEKAKAIA